MLGTFVNARLLLGISAHAVVAKLQHSCITYVHNDLTDIVSNVNECSSKFGKYSFRSKWEYVACLLGQNFLQAENTETRGLQNEASVP